MSVPIQVDIIVTGEGKIVAVNKAISDTKNASNEAKSGISDLSNATDKHGKSTSQLTSLIREERQESRQRNFLLREGVGVVNSFAGENSKLGKVIASTTDNMFQFDFAIQGVAAAGKNMGGAMGGALAALGPYAIGISVAIGATMAIINAQKAAAEETKKLNYEINKLKDQIIFSTTVHADYQQAIEKTKETEKEYEENLKGKLTIWQQLYSDLVGINEQKYRSERQTEAEKKVEIDRLNALKAFIAQADFESKVQMKSNEVLMNKSILIDKLKIAEQGYNETIQDQIKYDKEQEKLANDNEKVIDEKNEKIKQKINESTILTQKEKEEATKLLNIEKNDASNKVASAKLKTQQDNNKSIQDQINKNIKNIELTTNQTVLNRILERTKTNQLNTTRDEIEDQEIKIQGLEKQKTKLEEIKDTTERKKLIDEKNTEIIQGRINLQKLLNDLIKEQLSNSIELINKQKDYIEFEKAYYERDYKRKADLEQSKKIIDIRRQLQLLHDSTFEFNYTEEEQLKRKVNLEKQIYDKSIDFIRISVDKQDEYFQYLIKSNAAEIERLETLEKIDELEYIDKWDKWQDKKLEKLKLEQDIYLKNQDLFDEFLEGFDPLDKKYIELTKNGKELGDTLHPSAEMKQWNKELTDFWDKWITIFTRLNIPIDIILNVRAQNLGAYENLGKAMVGGATKEDYQKTEYDSIKQWEDAGLALFADNEDMRTKIKKQATLERTKLDLQEYTKYASHASKAVNLIAGFTSAAHEKNIIGIESEKDIYDKMMDKKMEDENLSAEQKDKLREEKETKDAEYDARISVEKSRQWRAERDAKGIMSIIDTAAAVVEALPNVVLAVIAGTMGAIETALIYSQPEPKFHTGGMMDLSSISPSVDVPFVARGGERVRVTTENQERALQSSNVNHYNVNIDLRHSTGHNGASIKKEIEKLMKETGKSNVADVFVNNRKSRSL